MWWLACELIFDTCKVKWLEEKYNLLMANLPADVTCSLLHVMSAKPKTDVNSMKTKEEDYRYNLLKEVIFQCYMSTKYNSFIPFLAVKLFQAGQKLTSSWQPYAP